MPTSIAWKPSIKETMAKATKATATMQLSVFFESFISTTDASMNHAQSTAEVHRIKNASADPITTGHRGCDACKEIMTNCVRSPHSAMKMIPNIAPASRSSFASHRGRCRAEHQPPAGQYRSVVAWSPPPAFPTIGVASVAEDVDMEHALPSAALLLAPASALFRSSSISALPSAITSVSLFSVYASNPYQTAKRSMTPAQIKSSVESRTPGICEMAYPRPAAMNTCTHSPVSDITNDTHLLYWIDMTSVTNHVLSKTSAKLTASSALVKACVLMGSSDSVALMDIPVAREALNESVDSPRFSSCSLKKLPFLVMLVFAKYNQKSSCMPNKA